MSINHIKSKREGVVFATARNIHKGRTTHLWEVRIVDEEDTLISIAKMTNIVLSIPKNKFRILKSLFDKIKTHYSSKLPFVAYHKPNTDNVSAFFMEDIALSFVSNFEEKGFVFAPFNSDEKAIIFSEEKSLMMSEELQLEAYVLQEQF